MHYTSVTLLIGLLKYLESISEERVEIGKKDNYGKKRN